MSQDIAPTDTTQSTPGESNSTAAEPSKSSLASSLKEGSMDKKIALASYVLMLVTPLLWFTSLVALIISYVQRGDASPLVKQHYSNIIKTFWISFICSVVLLLFYFILTIIMFSAVGFGFGGTLFIWIPGLILTIWFYVRMVSGVLKLLQDKPWRK
ncbi:hypothetical protein [Halomonas sp. NO4]|uniref:hypothetical protein n=1 Tax=Halomonas sp. NO4 TaxID=2484813 RepID=UPI0013CF90C6|nr:hypothetical protein [Halomonas sp. NO4]